MNRIIDTNVINFLYIHVFVLFFFQNLVNTFSFTVNNQMPKINQLERDVINLADDMDNLKEQVLEDFSLIFKTDADFM